MSSILTNNSAMTALSTLRNINKSLTATQTAVSTGKSVATAKENAALWSVAAVMSSDVSGFKGVQDSLSLGGSSVGVARAGAETVVDLLNQMKERIVAAQADNVDRVKIDADVQALKGQIQATVAGSQFNGQNLLVGTADVDVLSSLNRTDATTVATDNITVARQNLETGTLNAQAGLVNTTNGANATLDTAAFAFDSTSAAGDSTIFFDAASLAVGDVINVNIGGEGAQVTLTSNAAADISSAVASAINSFGLTGLTADGTTTGGNVVLSTTVGNPFVAEVSIQRNGTAGAGLANLASLAVDTAGNATTALANIEGLIQTATDAAAAFGSTQARIETQQEFIKNLSDNLKSGIGALVDADMEETSARLQALQVQQQLGVQSLSIANQQPQTLLSLFR
jgi:flagellin